MIRIGPEWAATVVATAVVVAFMRWNGAVAHILAFHVSGVTFAVAALIDDPS